MDTSEYLGLFLDESRESLQALNASLLDLERDPADAEPLTVIFRVAHSLKGMSATMGFEAMARLTHRMEEVLAKMRDDGAPVTPAISDALFACLDTLQEMVDRVAEDNKEEVDASSVMERLNTIATATAGPAVAVAQTAATLAPPAGAPALSDYERMVVSDAHERGLIVFRVGVTFDEGCQLAAARAFMVVQELEAFGDLIKSEPPAESIEAGEVEGGVVLLDRRRGRRRPGRDPHPRPRRERGRLVRGRAARGLRAGRGRGGARRRRGRDRGGPRRPAAGRAPAAAAEGARRAPPPPPCASAPTASTPS